MPENIKRANWLALFFTISIFATWVSQSLLDFSVGILGLVWVYSFYKFNDASELFKNKYLNRIFPAMFGYFFIACLGYIFNARPESDPFFSLSRFVWIIIIYVLAWATDKAEFQIKNIKYIFYLLVLPAIYGFNIFLNNGFDILSGVRAGNRIVGLVNSATYHGHTAGFLFLMSFSWLILNWQKARLAQQNLIMYLKSNFLFCLVTAAVFFSLFYSKTRGALLSTFTASIFLIWLYFGNKIIKWLVLVALLGATLVLTTPLKSRIFRPESDGCRLQLALVHVEMVKQFPLLGIGYRDNMRSIIDYWPESLAKPECESLRTEGSQAHNQYLNAAATTGLLGLVLYLIVVLYFLYINWQWVRLSDSVISKVCLILQIYFIASCMTEVTFEFSKIRHLILCVWALSCTMLNRIKARV